MKKERWFGEGKVRRNQVRGGEIQKILRGGKDFSKNFVAVRGTAVMVV